MTRKRGSGQFFLWSFIFRSVTNTIILVTVYLFVIIVHKEGDAEHIDSMSDLLFGILIFATIMAVTLPCYWMYLITNVAKLDNNVSDRDIELLFKNCDFKSLRELSEFGFEIVWYQGRINQTLEMNDFRTVLTLFDLWYDKMDPVYVVRIFDFIIEESRKYYPWEQLSAVNREEEIVSRLEQFLTANIAYADLVEQHAVKLIIMFPTETMLNSLVSIIGTKWCNQETILTFFNTSANKEFISLDSLHHIVKTNIHDKNSPLWQNYCIWQFYKQMYQFNGQQFKNMHVGATRENYLFDILHSCYDVCGENNFNTLLTNDPNAVMLFISEFEYQKIFSFLTNDAKFDIRKTFARVECIPHFTTVKLFTKWDNISRLLFHESILDSRLGMLSDKFDQSFKFLSDMEALALYRGYFDSLDSKYAHYKWLLYSLSCSKISNSRIDILHGSWTKTQNQHIYKSLVADNIFVRLQTSCPGNISLYFDDPAVHIAVLLCICCEFDDLSKRISIYLRDILRAIKLEYKLQSHVNLGTITSLFDDVTEMFPKKYCKLLLMQCTGVGEKETSHVLTFRQVLELYHKMLRYQEPIDGVYMYVSGKEKVLQLDTELDYEYVHLVFNTLYERKDRDVARLLDVVSIDSILIGKYLGHFDLYLFRCNEKDRASIAKMIGYLKEIKMLKSIIRFDTDLCYKVEVEGRTLCGVNCKV